jgi:hypothetical protein
VAAEPGRVMAVHYAAAKAGVIADVAVLLARDE